MYQTSANAELIQCTVNDWGCLSSSFSKVIVEIAIAFQIYNPISYPSIRSLWSKTRSGMPHARQLRDWRSQLRLDPVWTSNHLKLGMPWSEWSQNCCCFFLPLFSSAQLFAIPTPIEGEDGGDKTILSNSIFFAWKPWDRDPTHQKESQMSLRSKTSFRQISVKCSLLLFFFMQVFIWGVQSKQAKHLRLHPTGIKASSLGRVASGTGNATPCSLSC